MFHGSELNLLFSQVFGYSATEAGHRIGFLVDVPARSSDDTQQWKERRRLAMQWARALAKTSFHVCQVYAFESIGCNNPNFIHPVHCIALTDSIPETAEQLEVYLGEVAEIYEVYSRSEFWIALTQFSLTNLLHIAAARYGFRAASMPGFTSEMLPALSVDVAAVDARVSKLARALSKANLAEINFDVHGRKYTLTLDLNFRIGIASSGRFTSDGQAGTIPSGVAYIVPYEGEKSGVISMTEGILPIEKDGMLVLCEVSENRIVCIDGENSFADELRTRISADAAHANIAKLGLGVLCGWGIEPIGIPLFDEKITLHIGLGRSEHIGGVTSPADFKIPTNARHIDYIFHPRLMPDIQISTASLSIDGNQVCIMARGKYQLDNL